MDNTMAALGILVLIVLLVTVGPLITIWALNTMFMLNIPFTFWTWLATLWLCWIVGGVKKSSKE